MARTYHIPFSPGDPNAPVFPNCCVSCGAPQETESGMHINRNVMRKKRQVQVELKLRIPHCRQCAKATKSVFIAGCIPFVLGFLLVGAAAFLFTAYGVSVVGLDEYGRSDQSPSLILGAFVGLCAGFAGGFVFEWLGRIILLPFFGHALLRAPMLAAQLIDDSDYVAGLRGTLDRDATHLELVFANDEVASEFAALNPAAVAGLVQ